MTTTAALGIRCVELEITGTCQLRCTHCCTNSSPQAPVGTMTRDDWQAVIGDIADVGIPAVQFIGGEPTLYPHLPQLIDHALDRRLNVEVYSNLTHIRPSLWARLERDGVRLATSYYSDRAEEHERITRGRGSHTRTRATIAEAVRRGVPLRVGIVEVLEGQRVEEAVADLSRLGVTHIKVDRTRKVGRAAEGGATSVSELCGNCFHQNAAVGPNGDVYGCIMSRSLPTGNVRQTRLRDILGGARWAETAAMVPRTTAGCSPSDSNGCMPKTGDDCDPSWGDVAPAPSGHLASGVIA